MYAENLYIMAKAFIVPAYYQLLFLGNCIYLQKGIFPQNKMYIEYQTKMNFKPKSLLNIVFIVLFYVYIIIHHMKTNIIVYSGMKRVHSNMKYLFI